MTRSIRLPRKESRELQLTVHVFDAKKENVTVQVGPSALGKFQVALSFPSDPVYQGNFEFDVKIFLSRSKWATL